MSPPLRESGWQGMAQRRGVRSWLLLPLAAIYGALLSLRRLGYALGLFPMHRLPVPVLVVGNVVVGGAGKTPTTLALIDALRERGWRVGVVSRGHGRRGPAVVEVQPDSDPAACGDEPLLIRRRAGVPVWVGQRRVEAARALLNAHPEVNLVVCDDGLQHWALRSDLRIAVFDDRGLGNGWLLPAGLLREPWPIADATRAPQLMLQPPRMTGRARVPVPASTRAFEMRRDLADHAVNAAGQSVALESLRTQPVLALAAIARPQAFFAMLAQAGVHPERCVALPDHAEASALSAALAGWRGTVLCTEKDLVKIDPAPPGIEAWAVPLTLTVDPAFFDAVDQALRQPLA